MKRIALILVCCVVVAALTLRQAEAEPTLGIGSNAPALDIEHYFHEDDPKVTEFEDGKIYVVEFWATWCPPCVASMPHLSELQQKYRQQGVQIVSITDESVDEVEAILSTPHPQAKESYADITSAYTLTADPDRSSHQDYMAASNQQGIPTSFIVGKSGVIEWIGHPMEIDEPLSAVVNDTWDREAFKAAKEREEAFEKAIQEFAQLAGTGNFDEAGKMLKEQIASADDEETKERWIMVQHQFNLLTGQANESDFAYYREDLKTRLGQPGAVAEYAMSLYGMIQNGGNVGPLAGEAITALKSESETAEGQVKAICFYAMARLLSIDEKLEEALAAQEKAVEFAPKDSRTLARSMTLFRDELKEKLTPALELEDAPIETSDDK